MTALAHGRRGAGRRGHPPLWNDAQKFLGIMIAIGEAMTCVLSGIYGSGSQLGTGNAILIILQLFFAGTSSVVCLDELLQKGYGLGSRISMFIATNICNQMSFSVYSNLIKF